jgi:hypothetical protein
MYCTLLPLDYHADFVYKTFVFNFLPFLSREINMLLRDPPKLDDRWSYGHIYFIVYKDNKVELPSCYLAGRIPQSRRT